MEEEELSKKLMSVNVKLPSASQVVPVGLPLDIVPVGDKSIFRHMLLKSL